EMVLPEGGSGPALAAAARAMRPELRVLLTSGHAPADLARAFGPVCGERLLAKPFSRETLAAEIRRTLEA
ncbi:MAG: hybrid sensor histidine kinase/response regulator, partial [Rhizobiales bacterium]|nr:hybrid sensor histidine kinase/response regulator [Hyphomicrobiales bacterium]